MSKNYWIVIYGASFVVSSWQFNLSPSITCAPIIVILPLDTSCAWWMLYFLNVFLHLLFEQYDLMRGIMHQNIEFPTIYSLFLLYFLWHFWWSVDLYFVITYHFLSLIIFDISRSFFTLVLNMIDIKLSNVCFVFVVHW